MTTSQKAQEFLHAGDPVQALQALQDEVRGKPGDAKLRIFLFQLLCVLGQWERALSQLKLIGELDGAALAMVQTYREAIQCEILRREVFAGRKSPMVFGHPEAWLGLLIESLLLAGQGQAAKGQELREQAFDQAPSSAGAVVLEGEGKEDSEPISFDWIADADMRLGPVLETIVNGRYYWLPFARLSQVQISRPEDLRDAVWMPAHIQFNNGGETVALIPTRYPGSEESEDGLVRLCRKTLWQEAAQDYYTGLGQRVLTTPEGEFSLMDIRSIQINSPPNMAEGAEDQ